MPQFLADTTATLVTLIALWFPAPAAVLAIIPLGLTLGFGTRASEILPCLVIPLAVATSCRRRVVVLTTVGFFLFGAARNVSWNSHSAKTANLGTYWLLLGCLVLVGLGVRTLVRAQRRRRRDLEHLAARNDEIRREERERLAAELRRVVSGNLAAIQDLLGALRSVAEPAALRDGLQAIDAQCRGALAELRVLVGMLRDTDNPQALSNIRVPTEAAERAEHDLTASGHPADIDVDAGVDLVHPSAQHAINRVIQEAVSTIINRCAAGSPASIRAYAAGGEVRVDVSCRMESRDPTQQDRTVRLQERLTVLGGSLHTAEAGGVWTMTARLPFDPDATTAGATEAGRTRGRHWWALVKRRVAQPRLLATILLGVLALQAGQTLLATPSAAAPIVGVAVAIALIALVWWPPLGYAMALVVCVLHGALLHNTPAMVLLVVALVIHAAAAERWRPTVVLAAGLVVHTVAAVLFHRERAWPVIVDGIMIAGVTLFVALLARYFYHTRRSQLRMLSVLTARRAELRARERELLARELHDVIAHQFTIITLQVMGHGYSDHVQELEQVLERIRAATGTTQLELELLVRVMGDGAAPDGELLVRPSSLAEVIRRELSDGGHDAVVEIDPAADELSPAIQRTLTRALQESTTNILRYAAPSGDCRYRVAVGADTVRLTVRSPLAPEQRRSELSSGYGLRGIGERVDLQGGVFRAGPDGGDWLVQLTLPRAT